MKILVRGEVTRVVDGETLTDGIIQFEREHGGRATYAEVESRAAERVWEHLPKGGDASGAELSRDDVKIVPTARGGAGAGAKRKVGKKGESVPTTEKKRGLPAGPLRAAMREVMESPKTKRSAEGWVAVETWRAGVEQAYPEHAAGVRGQPWHNAVSNMVRDGEVKRRGSHSTAEFRMGELVQAPEILRRVVEQARAGKGDRSAKELVRDDVKIVPTKKTAVKTVVTVKELAERALKTFGVGETFERRQLEAAMQGIDADRMAGVSKAEVASVLMTLREDEDAIERVKLCPEDPLGAVYKRI